ncbi:hypothetical protein F4859DRAFT_110994 [Xylaria cf. heliscus]|nr:hypothetical protein F4859DRAFT_110994 [Xylaria cf. heliscus]
MDTPPLQHAGLPTGFTMLHKGGTDPDYDIFFIHGLNGRPDKSWTYPRTPSEHKTKPSLGTTLRKLFRKNKKHLEMSDNSPDSTAVQESQDIFWPRDLLPQESMCKTARIMTYGYDSDVIKFADNANLSTITDHGETLLNGLATVRTDCQNRPLMLIVHSLGGLVVKSALNRSALQKAPDLRAVVESTFAIIFFGTPHRGSDFAEIGKMAAHIASILTGRPYNPHIVQNLAQNSELLRQLRQNFEDVTLDVMRKASRFESSTFQESRGWSTTPGFQNKVVEDDASEGGAFDRNDHIDRNHMDMIKFSGLNDPEYNKVRGEIQRHIKRFRDVMGEEESSM